MRKSVILTIAALLIAATAGATVWKPTNIPVAHIADRNRYVCNPEGIISQEVTDSIDAIFRAIEDSTGIETLIAVVSQIDPDDCYEFAYQLGEGDGFPHALVMPYTLILISRTYGILDL